MVNDRLLLRVKTKEAYLRTEIVIDFIAGLAFLLLIIEICIIPITTRASGRYSLAGFALVRKFNHLPDTKQH